MARVSGLILTVLSATMLTACSSGSSSGSISVPAVDPATITTTNAPDIAGGVMAAALEGGDVAAFAGLGGGAPVGVGGSDPILSKVGAISADQAQTLLKQDQLNMTRAAFEAPIEECPVAGFIDISANLADAETLTPGDTITFIYVDCSDGAVTIDGTFAMSITEFSGDFVGGAFSFGVTVQLSSFTVAGDGVSSVADGTLSMSIDATALPSMSMKPALSMSSCESEKPRFKTTGSANTPRPWFAQYTIRLL